MMARAFIHINGEKTCILYYVLMNAFIALYYVINFISVIAQEKQAFGWGNLAINGKLLYNRFFLGGGGADCQGGKALYIRGITYEILEIDKKKFPFTKCGTKLLSFKYNVLFCFYDHHALFFLRNIFPTVGENDMKHFTTAFRLRAKITPRKGGTQRNSKLKVRYLVL